MSIERADKCRRCHARLDRKQGLSDQVPNLSIGGTQYFLPALQDDRLENFPRQSLTHTFNYCFFFRNTIPHFLVRTRQKKGYGDKKKG